MGRQQVMKKLKHLALIMDGNRRWARQNKLQVFKGHDKVAREMIERLVDRCVERKIGYLTLWAFSTENWKRDQKEIDNIMNLLREMLNTTVKKLHEKGVRIKTIGDLTKLDQDIQDKIDFWQQETQDNEQITVTFALNYGGQDEILRAVKKIMRAGVSPKDLTKAKFEKFLDTTELPRPDLIIRPGGEQRLSGYLSWQAAYAELYFTDVLMPDFDEKQLDLAIAEFKARERRFGS